MLPASVPLQQEAFQKLVYVPEKQTLMPSIVLSSVTWPLWYTTLCKYIFFFLRWLHATISGCVIASDHSVPVTPGFACLLGGYCSLLGALLCSRGALGCLGIMVIMALAV